MSFLENQRCQRLDGNDNGTIDEFSEVTFESEHDTGCYRFWPVPMNAGGWPAFMEIVQGEVWFTLSWSVVREDESAAIGRLLPDAPLKESFLQDFEGFTVSDATTGLPVEFAIADIYRYPLNREFVTAPESLPPAYPSGPPIFPAPYPWDLDLVTAFTPAGHENNYLVLTEFSDAQVLRFNLTRARFGNCPSTRIQNLQFDEFSGRGPDSNPCIVEVFPAEFLPRPTNLADETILESDTDEDGRVWFTRGQSDVVFGQVGFILSGQNSFGDPTLPFEKAVIFPPLGADENGKDEIRKSNASGIIVDDKNGDIWFGEFFRRRVGRLSRAD